MDLDEAGEEVDADGGVGDLGEGAVREVAEERALADGAVADQDEAELVVEDGVHHGGRAVLVVGDHLRPRRRGPLAAAEGLPRTLLQLGGNSIGLSYLLLFTKYLKINVDNNCSVFAIFF